MAMRAVLKAHGVEWDRVLELTEPVQDRIRSLLSWPGELDASLKEHDV